MQQDGISITEALQNLDPSRLDYQQWCNVGMALKLEGLSADIWDAWSARDPARYHAGECHKKWNTFRGNESPVTAGTIIQYALDQGWSPAGDSAGFDWDDEIVGPKKRQEELKVVQEGWLEVQDVPPPPENMDGVKELIRYLKALFEASENVGFVTESYKNDDGRYVPTKGCYDRTAGQLIQALSECKGDLGAVLGDYNEEAGAWIRFNPLDGKGVKNDNVTEFRYALVESDTLDLSKQYSLMKELQLPIAVMVHSGGKSIHAIVRIDAQNYDEYRKRVDYLYSVCQKNGMQLDRQNRNPSRLSRMPGVFRKGKPQYIIAENIGQESFLGWKEYIESVNDDLPDSENLGEALQNLPELSPELIHGVLRMGHKMLISGPSKAGKSFALIELCIAIAQGGSWMGFECTAGSVMYVNLELDRASCLHRFADVYKVMGIPAAEQHPEKIEIWNLRGSSTPMDKLAPKLIRRAKKKNFTAIIIDPIYKVITGDENSADQMSLFCNQFDKICTELNSAVIYCHHHSKGSQGQKRSMDRASGSGVFARDPDALLDLIELDIPLQIRDEMINKATRDVCIKWLKLCIPDIEQKIKSEDFESHVSLMAHCKTMLSDAMQKVLANELNPAQEKARWRSGWRIEGILREFAPMQSRYVWFEYPIHIIDQSETLKALYADGERKGSKAREIRKANASQARLSKREQLENAILLANFGDPVTVKQLADYLDAKENTVRKWLRENGYAIDRNTKLVMEVDVMEDDEN